MVGHALLAYIDPGTSQQVWSTLAPIIGVILAGVSLFLLQLRLFWGWWRALWAKLPTWGKFALSVMGVALVVMLILLLGFLVGGETEGGSPVEEPDVRTAERTAPAASKQYKKVLVLGMDGLDPNLLEEMMAGGQLPGFRRLKEIGSFSRLQTTTPPESPVAWLAAATGCNPGRYGVYDFIHRRPADYTPDLAILKRGRQRAFGGGGSAYVPVTDQPAFWNILAEQGRRATVIRWPITFPPLDIHGRMLSGLGTPDVTGALGTYRFFTTGKVGPEDKAPERVIEVQWDNDQISTELPGPKIVSFSGAKTSQLKMKIERADSKDPISVRIGKNDPLQLRVGAWSPWQSVSFPGGLSRSCPAMIRLYLTSIEPELNLYVSPLQIDPAHPACPITCPEEFSKELADIIGPYATLGMPEDGQAVQHGRIPLSAFLEMCDQITAEREAMLQHELARFEDGLLCVVFDTSDRIQHHTCPK